MKPQQLFTLTMGFFLLAAIWSIVIASPMLTQASQSPQSEVIKLDEYTPWNFDDETARLDNAEYQLRSLPDYQIYVVAYNKLPGRSYFHLLRDKHYLMQRGLPEQRITTIDGGNNSKENSIQLWLVPPGGKPPNVPRRAYPNKRSAYLYNSMMVDFNDWFPMLNGFDERLRDEKNSVGYVYIYGATGKCRNYMRRTKDTLREQVLHEGLINLDRIKYRYTRRGECGRIYYWIVRPGAELPKL